ncbi:hypothetical protein GCM10027018_15370 [Paenibacillus thermoaerophilus]
MAAATIVSLIDTFHPATFTSWFATMVKLPELPCIYASGRAAFRRKRTAIPAEGNAAQ